ncbi:hypothetical protein AG1IA_07308 [Rhizoctonia solani AG-1 IA]|uniref:Uncharacterized protein n=1 Tax=Thanatephorus cucumeris (strain AG1-IA) TaxID=983506 RepID=L8WPG0_THACA|nr:hypothetical protein AG1IA_07308 [Rhizoctonia solani AG-1 IA]
MVLEHKRVARFQSGILWHFDESANVFLNYNAFQSRIISDNFLETVAGDVINIARPPLNTRPYSSDEFWRTCTLGWGCLNGTWTNALLNHSPDASNITNALPLSSFQSQYPTIIDQKFMCPVFKTKQTGALLVSVFVEIQKEARYERDSVWLVITGITVRIALLTPHQQKPKTQGPPTTNTRVIYQPGRLLLMLLRSMHPIYPIVVQRVSQPSNNGIQCRITFLCVPPKKRTNYLRGHLPLVPQVSQLSLNRTISRDTTNTSQAARAFGEHDHISPLPPRALVQNSRGPLILQPSQKPHHAEYTSDNCGKACIMW